MVKYDGHLLRVTDERGIVSLCKNQNLGARSVGALLSLSVGPMKVVLRMPTIAIHIAIMIRLPPLKAPGGLKTVPCVQAGLVFRQQIGGPRYEAG